MELLKGTSERVVMEEKGNKGEEKEETKSREEEGEEEEITREELIEHIKELKKGKTPGENGIENKAWRLMPKEKGERMWELINRI